MDKVSAEVIRVGNYSLQAGIYRSSFKLLDDSTGKAGEPTEGPARPVPTTAPGGQEGPAEPAPTVAPQGQEGPQEGPSTEGTATGLAASPASSGRTDDLLEGLDVVGLMLSPRLEDMSADEEDAGGGQ